MTSLIIFGGGFIARSIIECQSPEINISVVSRVAQEIRSLRPNMTLYSSAEQIPIRSSFDMAVYCAGPSLPHAVTAATAAQAQKSLQLALHVARRSKIFVYMSSGGALYEPSNLPMDESCPADLTSPYALMHVKNELAIKNFVSIPTRICFRLGNPFGPHQDPMRSVGFVTQCLMRAQRGEEVQIFGDGTTSRDFFYAVSIGTALGSLWKKRFTGFQIYNFGSGQSRSLNYIVGCVEQVLGRRVNTRYLDSISIYRPIVKLNVEKFQRDFDDVVIVPASDGIRLCCALFDAGRPNLM